MAITFTGFLPGESVQLRRPSATPGVPSAALETLAADSAGRVAFVTAAVAGAYYQAVSPSRRAWQLASPQAWVSDYLVPPIWSSVP